MTWSNPEKAIWNTYVLMYMEYRQASCERLQKRKLFDAFSILTVSIKIGSIDFFEV